MQVNNKLKLGVLALTASLLAAGGGGASAAQLDLLDRANGIEDVIQVEELRGAYRRTLASARQLGVAPKRDAIERELAPAALERALKRLRGQVRTARAGSGAPGSAVGTPEAVGVSDGTLASIAACESGGDPSAISSNGAYRGKYQFDMSTWASVGGSGDPASAPEAEQDYRAALLYSRSGSSPWPVCG